MKKLLILCIIFVCGCSNKMICTYKEDYEDIKILNKVEFNFKDKKYLTIDKMTFTNEDEASKYFDDIKEYIEEYNLVLNKNTIISKLEYNIDSTSTKASLKEKYEGYNYKCK